MIKKIPEVVITDREIFNHLKSKLRLNNITVWNDEICYVRKITITTDMYYSNPKSYDGILLRSSEEPGKMEGQEFIPLSKCTFFDKGYIQKIEFMYKALEYLEKQMPKED